MFRLTPDAIQAINDTAGVKAKLVLTLNLSENSINRLLRENEVNGDLTKEAALLVIQKETGLARKKILSGELVMQT